ncbi:hypothetical protein TVAG_143770 [Trichomonas vaginalis G3]|uniref:Uncharacterized protein n=1 Tax=Trichomonas vaginalis (strain ATCC PRA-98 / G3) TaxID=412133 RepID=A2G447_TRIV3|nr:GAT-like domain family [Trichomonas vaginalis G3]EAX88065.1 hypothetical protein TVAG_143770 [Trichomonas vaginalis G3]KAI5552499.1 GAT-like domain family [Trichomonas vaginalis G3]|eukprot:XP_001300995.1 hypothetical protein [Trichomonas vaginalis G3]
MSIDLSSLEAHETNLLNEIANLEKQLSKAVEINNQLEASALLQSYIYYKQERPKRLQSVFQEMEKSLYKTEDELTKETHELNSQSEDLERESKQIHTECENKRKKLADLLKEISKMRETAKPIEITPPSFDKMCSRQVEQLARQFAATVGDVNEEDLIMFLARGKSDIDIEQIIEKARALGQARYQVKCMSLVIECLEKANETLRNLDYDDFHNTADGATTLSNTLDYISNQLSTIAQEADTIPVSSNVQQQMDEINELQEKLRQLRQRLINALSSDSAFPMPPEISNSEMEKEAMKECINALKQSSQSFIEYLNRIDSENIIDTRIATEDEIRNILQRYEELKQLTVN